MNYFFPPDFPWGLLVGILGAILRQYKEKTLGILMHIVKGFSAKVREKQHISSVSVGGEPDPHLPAPRENIPGMFRHTSRAEAHASLS